jgi:hypothetical protein
MTPPPKPPSPTPPTSDAAARLRERLASLKRLPVAPSSAPTTPAPTTPAPAAAPATPPPASPAARSQPVPTLSRALPPPAAELTVAEPPADATCDDLTAPDHEPSEATSISPAPLAPARRSVNLVAAASLDEEEPSEATSISPAPLAAPSALPLPIAAAALDEEEPSEATAISRPPSAPQPRSVGLVVAASLDALEDASPTIDDRPDIAAQPAPAAATPAAATPAAAPAPSPSPNLQALLDQQASLHEPDTITLDDEDQEATRIGPPPEVREVPVVHLTPLADLDDAAAITPSPLEVEVTRKVDRALLPAPAPSLAHEPSDEESTTRRPRPTPQAIQAPSFSEDLTPPPAEVAAPAAAPAPEAPATQGRGRLPRFSEMMVQRVEIPIGGKRRPPKMPIWLVAALCGVALSILILLWMLIA